MPECLLSKQVAPRSANAMFLTDVIAGLSKAQKRIPCKYLYDMRGSQMFDTISEQPEYYVTRTELAIMREYAAEMATALGEGVMLVELGSGSSIKTELLLAQFRRPVAYVPVDISGQHLQQTANRLRRMYPRIEILPVRGDFTQPFRLPASAQSLTHRAVYFPGSTIGNFEIRAAIELLGHVARVCGAGGSLLIGIDLQKDVRVVEAAYNDAAGVTAEFNLNLLRHVNRELDANFDLKKFAHRACYDEANHCVDIRLVSRCKQVVHLNGIDFSFEKEETIHTEYSHKYTIDGFASMAGRSGFQLQKVWTDPRQYFAVLHLELPKSSTIRSA